MNFVRPVLKHAFQSLTGYWTHLTRTLPRGTDLLVDIKRIVPIESIETVFDVGANVGQSVDFLLPRFHKCRIYSFEPVEQTFQTLHRRHGTNPRVNLARLGLSDRVGFADIHINHDRSECSLEYRYGEAHKEEIALSTVDAFCRESVVERIDLLKIDVEGHELQVLSGAKEMLQRNAIAFLFVEAEIVRSDRHFVHVEEYASFLKSYGYSLVGIYNQTQEWNGNSRLQFANALFGRNDVLSVNVQ